jgi:CheY-like chemotaxis protein
MRSEQDDEVLLIAVSGYASPDDVARAKAAGFDHHFGKPANPGALLSKIEGRLGARPGAH